MINCQIAGDLMAPYLDGTCSEDSRRALEEHIDGCEACRERLERMGGDTPDTTPGPEAVKLKAYAKKVKKHRVTVAAVTAFLFIAVAGALVLGVVNLTLKDMKSRNDPPIYSHPPTEPSDPNADTSGYEWDPSRWEGVYDLTAGPLATTAGEAGDFVLFTNNEAIAVELEGVEGTVYLWNTQYPDEWIQISSSAPHRFTGLSAACRYRVTVEAPAGTPVTVTDGREVSFFKSLRYVLHSLFGLGEDPYSF